MDTVRDYQHGVSPRSEAVVAAPGDRAVAEATRRAKAFAAKWGKLYPAAVACLLEGLGHLTTYLRFAAEHW